MQPCRLHSRRNSWPFSYVATHRIVSGPCSGTPRVSMLGATARRGRAAEVRRIHYNRERCSANITAGTQAGSGATWASSCTAIGARRCWPSRRAAATSSSSRARAWWPPLASHRRRAHQALHRRLERRPELLQQGAHPYHRAGCSGSGTSTSAGKSSRSSTSTATGWCRSRRWAPRSAPITRPTRC